MSNFVYSKAKQNILNGVFDFSTDDIRVLFVNQNYSPNQTSNEYVSDIPGSAIVYRSEELVNFTNTLGVLDADDLLITNYPGYAFKYLILYKNTGSDQSSPLIAKIEDSTGLPFVGSSPITLSITWDNGPNKIIAI
jgi:hypothetical protein